LTIENRIRIYLAICIDGVGYQETYSRLAMKAGTEVGNVQAEMTRQLDFEKEYRRNHRKRAYVKKKRKVKFYDKLRENAEKLVKENGKNLRYGSGVTGPFREDTARPTGAGGQRVPSLPLNLRAGRGGKVEFQCPHCEKWGHQRVLSKACLKNPSRQKNEESTSTICTPTVTEIGEEGAFREQVSTFRKILSLPQYATLVLTYVFLRVETGNGILGLDTNEVFAEFYSGILDLEELELHRLEDIGMCDG
jgi:hypothetical protein